MTNVPLLRGLTTLGVVFVMLMGVIAVWQRSDPEATELRQVVFELSAANKLIDREKFEEAAAILKSVIAIGDRIGNVYIISAANMMLGRISLRKNDKARACEYMEKAITASMKGDAEKARALMADPLWKACRGG